VNTPIASTLFPTPLVRSDPGRETAIRRAIWQALAGAGVR
jgi:hypothetical protein